MSFWNDPAYNTQKSLLVILLVAAAGFGVYKLVGDPTSNLEGSVYRGTKYNITNTGDPQAPTCKLSVTVGAIAGSDCTVIDATCNPVTGTTGTCTSGFSGNSVPCCCYPAPGIDGTTSTSCFSSSGAPVNPPTQKTKTQTTSTIQN